MTGMVLYDDALDEGCYKVRLLLGALGLPCTVIPVNAIPGAEQTRPPLLHLNPLGALPILVDQGTVLREAEAILCYLATRYDPGRTWLPADPMALGDVMAWLVFAARDLNAAVLARRHALFDQPGDGPALIAATRQSLRAMDDHMVLRGFEGAGWFVGSGPTVADLALAPAFALSRDAGIDHEAYPALRRWLRRVRTLRGFVTMPGIPDYH